MTLFRHYKSRWLKLTSVWHAYKEAAPQTLRPKNSAPSRSFILLKLEPSDILQSSLQTLFFLFKNDVTDEEYLEQFRAYPKNHAMGYDPPKVPSIIHRSTEQKAHNNQLYKIQQRITHLTRPVDLFLHQVWSLEDREQLNAEEMVELCSTFAILIRKQLAGRVGTVNENPQESPPWHLFREFSYSEYVSDWLRNLDDYFDAVETDSAEHTVAASLLFRGNAKLWWQDSRQTFQFNGGTWLDFKNSLTIQFEDPNLVQNARDELSHLKHRTNLLWRNIYSFLY
ncbi:hypothetical protein BGZ51_005845 [Haplosporangium sp. Z 767]|nr:hypothetical protein BGZ51_005845 [Haplosporangium sp. Z 767]